VKVAVGRIKNTQPHRDPGSIAGLKASIAGVGLINPLMIDKEQWLWCLHCPLSNFFSQEANIRT